MQVYVDGPHEPFTEDEARPRGTGVLLVVVDNGHVIDGINHRPQALHSRHETLRAWDETILEGLAARLLGKIVGEFLLLDAEPRAFQVRGDPERGLRIFEVFEGLSNMRRIAHPVTREENHVRKVHAPAKAREIHDDLLGEVLGAPEAVPPCCARFD